MSLKDIQIKQSEVAREALQVHRWRWTFPLGYPIGWKNLALGVQV